jgi:putative endonuclease
VTNDLKRRVFEHKSGLVDGFTQKYELKMLVYVQQYQYIQDAISLEKRLKQWRREWKLDLAERYCVL